MFNLASCSLMCRILAYMIRKKISFIGMLDSVWRNSRPKGAEGPRPWWLRITFLNFYKQLALSLLKKSLHQRDAFEAGLLFRPQSRVLLNTGVVSPEKGGPMKRKKALLISFRGKSKKLKLLDQKLFIIGLVMRVLIIVLDIIRLVLQQWF